MHSPGINTALLDLHWSQTRHLFFPKKFKVLYTPTTSSDIRDVSGREQCFRFTFAHWGSVHLGIRCIGCFTHTWEWWDTITSLQLKFIKMPVTNISLLCDVSTATVRPVASQKFRLALFESIHALSHPGANSTVKLVTQNMTSYPRTRTVASGSVTSLPVNVPR